MGELSSNKSDGSAARKARLSNKLQALSEKEKDWLEVTVRRVIYRLGEHASGAQLALISLSDLPKF